MYLRLFLPTLLALCTTATAAHTLQKQNNQIVIIMKNIDSQVNSSRQLIQNLAQDNPKVLNQFDLFAQTLRESYSSGQGFIDKDIYRIMDAVAFAAEKHRFQTRKDPDETPYIIHPIGVAYNLMIIGNVRDPDIIIGALLHDTVEDTDTTFEEIDKRFGARVAGFVKEVTDDKSLPKQARKQLQIEHAPEKSAGAAQIKLGDKLYNLTDLSNAPPLDWEKERIDTYFNWAKSVVDALPWVNAPLKQAVDNVIQNYRQNKTR